MVPTRAAPGDADGFVQVTIFPSTLLCRDKSGQESG